LPCIFRQGAREEDDPDSVTVTATAATGMCSVGTSGPMAGPARPSSPSAHFCFNSCKIDEVDWIARLRADNFASTVAAAIDVFCSVVRPLWPEVAFLLIFPEETGRSCFGGMTPARG